MICGVTTNHSETATGDAIRPKNARTVSPEPLWEVHPSVPNLLRYVKSGMYYARLKANGKQIRRSLGTDVFSSARFRLADFIKRVRTKKAPVGTFREARLAYEADLAAAHDIGENPKRYRRYCVKALLESWPELDSTQLSRIDAACPLAALAEDLNGNERLAGPTLEQRDHMADLVNANPLRGSGHGFPLRKGSSTTRTAKPKTGLTALPTPPPWVQWNPKNTLKMGVRKGRAGG